MKLKTYPVDGHGRMTVREILNHRTNIHGVTDTVLRARIQSGDHSLVRLLRKPRYRKAETGPRTYTEGPTVEVPVWVQSIPEGVITSDGSSADYYRLPENARQLQDLISYKDMNGQIAEIFRACYRYGQASHSAKLRDAKKILFYAQAEIDRLETYGDRT